MNRRAIGSMKKTMEYKNEAEFVERELWNLIEKTLQLEYEISRLKTN